VPEFRVVVREFESKSIPQRVASRRRMVELLGVDIATIVRKIRLQTD
jgi:hypothetical protein